MYLNKAIIIGNLTRDPETKALPSGATVTNFSLATNRTWKDKDGNKQEEVEYHNVVTFGKTAENVARFMNKGSQLLVEGRIQTRSWDDKDGGAKRYRTEIIAETVQFGNNPNAKSSSQEQQKPVQKQEQIDTIEYPEEDINPDDIPF